MRRNSPSARQHRSRRANERSSRTGMSRPSCAQCVEFEIWHHLRPFTKVPSNCFVSISYESKTHYSRLLFQSIAGKTHGEKKKPQKSTCTCTEQLTTKNSIQANISCPHYVQKTRSCRPNWFLYCEKSHFVAKNYQIVSRKHSQRGRET